MPHRPARSSTPGPMRSMSAPVSLSRLLARSSVSAKPSPHTADTGRAQADAEQELAAPRQLFALHRPACSVIGSRALPPSTRRTPIVQGASPFAAHSLGRGPGNDQPPPRPVPHLGNTRREASVAIAHSRTSIIAGISRRASPRYGRDGRGRNRDSRPGSAEVGL